MAEEYEVKTPEAVSIAYDVAGIGTRFIAAAIDTLVWIGLSVLIVLGCVGLALTSSIGKTIAIILGTTLLFLLFWGYFLIFETLWSGQTPGKRWVQIRVLKTSGYPIGLVDAVIRNLVRIVDWLPSLYSVGVLVMFLSPQSRRLGDYAAGTIVVKERKPAANEVLEGVTKGIQAAAVSQPPALGENDPDEREWALESLTPQDIRVAREYLDRASSLSPQVRQRLGNEIATHLADRIGARHALDPVRFLERVLYLRETE